MEKNIAILVWTSHTYETWHIEFQFFVILKWDFLLITSHFEQMALIKVIELMIFNH